MSKCTSPRLPILSDENRTQTALSALLVNPLLVSPKQAAKLIGVSEATLFRWVRQRPVFPRPVKLSPGCTRFRLQELLDFVASLETNHVL
jgi:prophage regulatory protein